MHSHINELSRLCWIMLATRSARGDSSSTMYAYLCTYVWYLSDGGGMPCTYCPITSLSESKPVYVPIFFSNAHAVTNLACGIMNSRPIPETPC